MITKCLIGRKEIIFIILLKKSDDKNKIWVEFISFENRQLILSKRKKSGDCFLFMQEFLFAT